MWDLNFKEIFSAFMVLFAVIDITGSIPIIINLRDKGGLIKAREASIVAFLIMLTFFFVGEPLLWVFGIDVYSFAIAGALVLFFIALEMIMGIEFFRSESLKTASIVPIAFPLIAGAGSLTTLLSLKAEYKSINILIALALNMIIVFLVLKLTHYFEKWIGKVGIIILRKIFGIILLAIAIKLFITNTGLNLGHKA